MEEHMVIVKDIILFFVTYILPIVSFVFSVYVFINSRKINKLEEKLKKYELDKIEQEKNTKQEAFVEARITRISSNNYRIKVWNSGNATAYNVDYNIPPEYEILLRKQVTPFEVLEPGENFEEFVILYTGSKSKYKVTTKWNDQTGKEFSNEKIRSIN